MAERYRRLFTLPENLYQEGAPLIIAAGALLKDNQNGKVLSQLKFRSISDKNIKAVKVEITGYDMGREVLCKQEHQYLDLDVRRDGIFGSKEAIALPDRAVRSYTVAVLAVYFVDGSRYISTADQWEPLEEQLPLDKRLWNVEYIAQYKLETTQKSEFLPQQQKNIWLCACGEVNHMGESCYSCGQDFDRLNELLDVDYLRENSNKRKLRQAEQNAAVDALKEAGIEKLKKLLYVIIPAALIVTAIFIYSSRNSKNLLEYEAASALYADGKYSEAEEAFKKLDDYSDSKAKADQARAAAQEETKMDKAVKQLEAGNFDKAIELFSAMKGDTQAEEYAQEALYRKALELIDNESLDEARECFIELGNYKDSKDKQAHFIWRKIGQRTTYDQICEGPLTTLYTYDSKGRLISELRKYSEHKGKNDETFKYSYKPDGSYSVKGEHGSVEYDENSNVLGENSMLVFEYAYGYYNNDRSKLCYADAYSIDGQAFQWEKKYDENGTITQMEDNSGRVLDYKNEYKDNLLILQEVYEGENLIARTNYKYDERDELIQETTIDTTGNAVTIEYSYGYIYAPDAKL